MRGCAISVLDGTFPCLVRENLEPRAAGIEKQGASAAAQMAESRFAHKPDKDGNPVGSLFKERGDLYFIVISTTDRWPSFKASLIDNRLAIDPKPVLCVNGDSCHQRSRNLLYVNIFAESEPGIGLVFVILLADPLCLPGIFLSSSSQPKAKNQSRYRQYLSHLVSV